MRFSSVGFGILQILLLHFFSRGTHNSSTSAQKIQEILSVGASASTSNRPGNNYLKDTNIPLLYPGPDYVCGVWASPNQTDLIKLPNSNYRGISQFLLSFYDNHQEGINLWKKYIYLYMKKNTNTTVSSTPSTDDHHNTTTDALISLYHPRAQLFLAVNHLIIPYLIEHHSQMIYILPNFTITEALLAEISQYSVIIVPMDSIPIPSQAMKFAPQIGRYWIYHLLISRLLRPLTDYYYRTTEDILSSIFHTEMCLSFSATASFNHTVISRRTEPYILITDTRDVISRTNTIFEDVRQRLHDIIISSSVSTDFTVTSPPRPILFIAMEPPTFQPGADNDSGWNINSLKLIFRPSIVQAMENLPIICSGTTMGNFQGLEDYLQFMKRTLPFTLHVYKKGGAVTHGLDQPLHIYHLHTLVWYTILQASSYAPAQSLSSTTAGTSSSSSSPTVTWKPNDLQSSNISLTRLFSVTNSTLPSSLRDLYAQIYKDIDTLPSYLISTETPYSYLNSLLWEWLQASRILVIPLRHEEGPICTVGTLPQHNLTNTTIDNTDISRKLIIEENYMYSLNMDQSNSSASISESYTFSASTASSKNEYETDSSPIKHINSFSNEPKWKAVTINATESSFLLATSSESFVQYDSLLILVAIGPIGNDVVPTIYSIDRCMPNTNIAIIADPLVANILLSRLSATRLKIRVYNWGYMFTKLPDKMKEMKVNEQRFFMNSIVIEDYEKNFGIVQPEGLLWSRNLDSSGKSHQISIGNRKIISTKIGMVGLVDARDIVFQEEAWSPLWKVIEKSVTERSWAAANNYDMETDLPSILVAAQEPAHMTIGLCKDYNSAWIRKCYGERTAKMVSDFHILCAGTIFGTTNAVTDYIKNFLVPACNNCMEMKGWEQGPHNVLLHYFENSRAYDVVMDDIRVAPTIELAKKLVKRTNLVIAAAEDGWICTLGYFDKAILKLDTEGYLVSVSNSSKRCAVVHQYDRFDWLLKHMVEKFLPPSSNHSS